MRMRTSKYSVSECELTSSNLPSPRGASQGSYSECAASRIFRSILEVVNSCHCALAAPAAAAACPFSSMSADPPLPPEILWQPRPRMPPLPLPPTLASANVQAAAPTAPRVPLRAALGIIHRDLKPGTP